MDPMEVEQSTEGVDQVASIPDDVVIRILSSLKDARLVAKCSLVSKRWQQMCARVQTLHFYSGLFKGHNDYEDIVGKMVLKTCELRSLQVALHQDRHTMADGNRPRGISDGALFKWLEHTSPHLENFYISDLGDGPGDAALWTGRFSRLASCAMLKTLVLSNSEITHAPGVNAPPLARLKSLTLYGVVCGADSAERVLGLCPRLEKLLITGCLGVTSLRIANPHLTTFALKEPPTPVSSITLRTPALTRLSLEQVAGVSLEAGRALTKLHLRSDHSIVLNLQNTGNLQDLKIVGKGWDWDSIQQLLYANPKVKNVAFYIKCRDQIHANGVPVEPVRLDRFFYTLQEVRKMEIGAELMWVLSAGRLDAAAIAEASPVWMPKVQEIKLGAVKAKAVYIDVLAALLNRCPELKRVVVDTSQLKKSSWNCSTFFSDVLRLQRAHPATDIKINMPDLFVPPKGREQ